jgi:DNA-binding transcriptional MerR regulator
MPDLTVSQLARQANVNTATIRYYERRGLLKEPKRSAAGYRLYSQEFVALINFIVKTKALGFTLKEIAEMLRLERQAANTCKNTQLKIANKIESIKNKINLLQKITMALQQLHQRCNSAKCTNTCSIIHCLNTDAMCQHC